MQYGWVDLLQHLLRPDQYQAPRKMLEFSRQHQEDRVIAGIENDIRQLTATEVDLEVGVATHFEEKYWVGKINV
jgi:hypothetical protein